MAAARHADMLVIPVTGQEDSAETAVRLLERLTGRDEHCHHLARNAIAVVSARSP